MNWKFVVCHGEGLDLHFVYESSTHYILGADMSGGTYHRGEVHQFGKLAPLFSVSLNPEEQTVSLKRYALAQPWARDSKEEAERMLAKIAFADRCAELVTVEVVERAITPADACAWRTEWHIPEAYNDRIEIWDRRTDDERETVFTGTPSRDLSFPFRPDAGGNSLEDMLHVSKQAWAAAGFPLPTDWTEFDNL